MRFEFYFGLSKEKRIEETDIRLTRRIEENKLDL
jgi:hypothetical protein